MGHVGGQAGLVSWGIAQPDRLSAAGNGRPWRAAQRGMRRGKGSRRTRGSPGGHRCAWFRRRGSVGGEFCGSGAQVQRGIRDGGGDSGCSSSIHRSGRKRKGWRTFLARRGGKGQCRTVALPGSHGGGCRCAWERESQREEEERMGNLGFLAAAEGFL
jgi:hypothetical protein